MVKRSTLSSIKDVIDLSHKSELLKRGIDLYSKAWSKEDALQQAFLYLANDKDQDLDRVGKLLCVVAARRIRESFSEIPIEDIYPLSDMSDIDIADLFKEMNGLQVTLCKLILEGKSPKQIIKHLDIPLSKYYRLLRLFQA